MGGRRRAEEPATRRGLASRLLRGLAVLVVLALVAGGVVAWRTGWAEERWQALRGDDDRPADPAAVAAPDQVDTRAVVVPGALAEPADGRRPLDPSALAAALAGLDDPVLGRHVIAAVGTLDGDDVAFRRDAGAPVAVPASTTKVVTSAAALFLLGPDHVFTTRTALLPAGAGPRELVLVGGGDPLLARTPTPAGRAATFAPARADVRTLARATAQALVAQGVAEVRVGFDDSLFTGPAVNPTWEADYVPDDVVSPISALWVDEGREAGSSARSADPAAAAAQAFAGELADAGVRVVGTPRRASGAGAAPVASVASPPLAQVVQRVLEVSDNEAAEVLLRQVGLADGAGGSFAGGQSGVARVLAANGIDMTGSVLHDGSGLSRDNRLAPSVLLGVLRLAASAKHPQLRAVLAGLPVAGFTGSLAERMGEGAPAGRGRVRAKTGTLSGVTSLAGIAVQPDGTAVVFALMADRVPESRKLTAQTALDDAAAALGACRCAAAS